MLGVWSGLASGYDAEELVEGILNLPGRETRQLTSIVSLSLPSRPFFVDLHPTVDFTFPLISLIFPKTGNTTGPNSRSLNSHSNSTLSSSPLAKSLETTSKTSSIDPTLLSDMNKSLLCIELERKSSFSSCSTVLRSLSRMSPFNSSETCSNTS